MLCLSLFISPLFHSLQAAFLIVSRFGTHIAFLAELCFALRRHTEEEKKRMKEFI